MRARVFTVKASFTFTVTVPLGIPSMPYGMAEDQALQIAVEEIQRCNVFTENDLTLEDYYDDEIET